MITVGILAFPNVQQLDLTGPYEVFATAPDTCVHLVWKSKETLQSVTKLPITPTTDFAECPKLDVLMIPGGYGVNALMQDEEVLDFIRSKASEARFVTSVCTGAMVLGASGLLIGKRATSHWNSVDLLASFGAIPVRERVVQDGKIITAGGVTAGIDFGLYILTQLFDVTTAQTVQLELEYNPAPPLDSGSPDTAPVEVVNAVKLASQPTRSQREAIIAEILKLKSFQ